MPRNCQRMIEKGRKKDSTATNFSLTVVLVSLYGMEDCVSRWLGADLVMVGAYV